MTVSTTSPDSSRSVAEVSQVSLTPRQIKMIMVGLLSGIFLSAVDGTIVSTALPTIVGDLGGFDQLTWVVTSYFVTSTVASLLIGKISDIFGRRPTFVLAILVFLAGSMLAGVANSMIMLVAFRALQGIGGGGLQSLAFIILGDVLSPRERGRYMGWFTGTFALSGLVGPLLGGLIVDSAALGWRWIFYLNLPIGAVTLVLVARYLKLPHRAAEVTVDWLGATLLSIGVGALLVAASIGGDDLAWSSPTILGLCLVGVVFSGLFIGQELRAPNPILPLRLFGNDIFRTGVALAFVTGGAMMSANICLPLFLQVVSGASATASGLMLAPMMLGLTVASIITGKRMTKTGTYRTSIRIGPFLCLAGIIGLTTLGVGSPVWAATPFVIINGIGIGMTMPPLSVAIQNGVSHADLGVATAANAFFRTLGMTFGVAAFGALLAARLRSELADRLPADQVADLDVAELTGSPETVRDLSAELHDVVVASVAEGVRLVYLAGIPVAGLMVLAAWRLRAVPLRGTSPMAEAAAESEALTVPAPQEAAAR
ncbi:MAG: MDR family MFS transporter [Actinomycetota bacterium]|nr:MDR family MFS transporter [Actinomycetota bacterium]